LTIVLTFVEYKKPEHTLYHRIDIQMEQVLGLGFRK